MKKYFLPQLLLLAFLSFTACKNNASSKEGTTDAENETVVDSTAHYGGATLYTLRDDMAKNPKETIKAVADMGYAYIESVNYEDGKFYGMEPQEYKAFLDSVNLKPISTHMGMVTLENADTLIADVKAVGFKYFVIPVPPMGMFKYDPETKTDSNNP